MIDGAYLEQPPQGVPPLERINQSLQPILAVNSAIPLIIQLQDYIRNSLPHDLSYISQPSGAMAARADQLLNGFESEEEVEAGFFRLITNLGRTPYLAQLADENIPSGLANGLHKGRYAARVKFVDPNSPYIKVIKRLTDPQYYNSLLDTAVLPANIPKTSFFWKMLIAEGKLPEIVAVLDKALVADRQFTKFQRAILGPPLAFRFMAGNALLTIPWPTGWIVSTAFNVGSLPGVFGLNYLLGNDPILSTIHASEAAFYSPTSMDETQSPGEVRESIINTSVSFNQTRNSILSRFRDVDEREKAEAAFDLIHRMRILGNMDDIQIGKAVTRARYNREAATFPKLKRVVDSLEASLGLNEVGLDKEKIIAAIEARYELSLLTARRQAQELAFQILEEERGGWLSK